MTREKMIELVIGRHLNACQAAGVEPASSDRLTEEMALMSDADLAEMLQEPEPARHYEVRNYTQYGRPAEV